MATTTVLMATVAVVAAVVGPGSARAAAGPPSPTVPAIAAGSVSIPPEADILAGLRAGHPRLVVTPEDVNALRQRIISDPTTAGLYAQVKARATALLGTPPVTYTKPDGFRLLEVSREVVRRMYDLGLVWLIDGDPAVAARGATELEAVAAFPDWNPIHFLDTAEMTHAVAIGYDWLFGALTPGQRATIEQALITKGLTPARDSYHGDAPFIVSYWTVVDHNWNNVVNGGETMGALAIADVDPGLAAYVAHEALTRLPAALAHYAPDGGWPEGVSYWEYATEYTVYALAGLQTALGTDFGLSAVDGLDRTGEVPIHMTGPTGQRWNWADDGEPRYAPSSPAELWLAQRFGREAFRTYELAHAQPAALDVVWYRPPAGPPEAVPRDRLFAGVDVATARSAWDDPTAWFVGAKGGRAGFNHNQLDLGSFVLESGGERFAIDLGRDDYNLPGYFQSQPGGPRWTYYRSRAEGHNTLVIDPDACEDQDPQAVATVTRFASAPDGAFSITDLTNAYRGTPVRRGVGLFDRSRVVVQDELSAPGTGSDVWWFMHTRASIQLTDGDRTAVLTQNGATIRARLATPAGATFSVTDAVPLPGSPQPAGNAPNPGVRRLTVHLQASGPTTISVTFDDGGAATPPSVTPLDQWHLSGPTDETTRAAATSPTSPNPCKGITGQPSPTSTAPPSSTTAPTTAPSAGGPARAVVARPAFTG